jgi:hypothetical protein
MLIRTLPGLIEVGDRKFRAADCNRLTERHVAVPPSSGRPVRESLPRTPRGSMSIDEMWWSTFTFR